MDPINTAEMKYRPKAIRGILIAAIVGALIGAAVVYFLCARRWCEERDDLFMLQIEWLVKQGKRAHQQDSSAIAQDTDKQLLAAIKIIDENFSQHPGARYWVEKIARYSEENGVVLSADQKRVVEKLSTTRQITDRVFYRWQ